MRERSRSPCSHRLIHHLPQHLPPQLHHPPQIQPPHERSRRPDKSQKRGGRYNVGADEGYLDSGPKLAVEREREPGLGDLRRASVLHSAKGTAKTRTRPTLTSERSPSTSPLHLSCASAPLQLPSLSRASCSSIAISTSIPKILSRISRGRRKSNKSSSIGAGEGAREGTGEERAVV